MTQTIIVFIIVIAAIGYSIYSFVKNLRKKETTACGGCNGCDIKKEITKHSSNNSPNSASISCGCK
jgi:hypothetical protein